MKSSTELFSFDLWQYLKKSAKFTLRSPLLYSVELLMTSLDRGATKISVRIEGSLFEIEDNGSGILLEDVKRVADIIEGTVSVESKVKALEILKGNNSTKGAGLLAVFAPDYKKIIIENVNDRGRVRLTIENGEFEIENSTEITKGTKISIHKKKGDSGEEKRLFKESCRWSQSDILLNGKKLKKENSIPGAMVSLKIKDGDGAVKGYLGIPERDDMCRLWFLHKGIIRERKTIPPYRGFVFLSALNIEGDYENFSPELIVPEIGKLYRYIAEKYGVVSGQKKERIEKLLFFHYRTTGQRDFIDDFTPFELSGKKKFLNLSEIESLVKKKKLYGLRRSEQLKKRSVTDSGNVLILSPDQIDFLINRLGLDISLLDPVKNFKRNESKVSIMLRYYRDKLFSLISSFFSREIDADLLWKEELSVLSLLNRYFSEGGGGYSYLLELGYDLCEVKICKGLSLYPLFFKESIGGIAGRKIYINLCRNNLFVKRMVKMIDTDNRNSELFYDFIRIEIKRFLTNRD